MAALAFAFPRVLGALTLALSLLPASLPAQGQEAPASRPSAHGPSAPADATHETGENASARDRRGPTPRVDGLPALPPDKSAQHRITLADGRVLDFTASASTIRLYNAANGTPLADVVTTSFTLDNAPARERPVMFIFNGGPGYASAWLDLGGLGPWRLPMSGEAAAPSAPPVLSDNPDTWLAFTDLVFVDPPGTGYSRILGGDDVRKSFWSVNGDIDADATVIRRWTEQNNRLGSPHWIAGESYGGFRAPKIAAKLQTDQGIGVAGLVMISPVLDFGQFNAKFSPLTYVGLLPSETAANREAKGPVTRADLADVEAYARGAYLTDLVRGVRDSAVVDQLSGKVADFTGLDLAFVRRLAGRVPAGVFLRERYRAQGKVGSAYDATVTGIDPEPFATEDRSDDQLRLGLHAPLTEAMVDVYRNRIGFVVENGRYQFINEQASRQWDWGRGNAEALTDLRKVLALDPRLHAFIAHGLTDVVTPYFVTQLQLDQIPAFGTPDRLQLKTYPGGHMIYIRDASRKALTEDVRKLVEGK